MCSIEYWLSSTELGVTTYGTDSRCGGHPLLLRIYVGAGVERGAQRRTPEYGTSVARSAERGVAERSTRVVGHERGAQRRTPGHRTSVARSAERGVAERSTTASDVRTVRRTGYGIRHTTYGIRYTAYDGV